MSTYWYGVLGLSCIAYTVNSLLLATLPEQINVWAVRMLISILALYVFIKAAEKS